MGFLLAMYSGKKPCKKLTDQEVVELIQQRGKSREHAIKCLLANHRGYVVTFQKQFMQLSPEKVESCFVDAVVDLETTILNGKFRAEAKLSTLLYRYTQNKCIDLWRKETTQKNTGTETELDYSLQDPAKNPHEEAESKDRNNRLTAAMQQLSEKCRNVLVKWAEGYSMKEIAEMYGLKNANTAKATKSNCMKKLGEIINPVSDSNK